LAACAATLGLAVAGCMQLPREAPATPQRPTFSSDTSTTAPGTIEVEAGLYVDPSDRYAIPVSPKFGVGDRTEFFLGWEPWQRVDRKGGAEDGIGDLFGGVRHRLRDEDELRPSVATQLSGKLPTASESRGLGTGEVDVFLAGILTKNLRLATLTGFYQLGILGDPVGNGLDVEHGLALAGTVPLEQRLSGFVEIAARLVGEQDREEVFGTAGVAYARRPGLVFDAAFSAGLTDDAPDWVLLLGVTTNLGELLPRGIQGKPPIRTP